MCVNVNRVTRGRRGVRIEVFTVILMVIEAGVSIGAGNPGRFRSHITQRPKDGDFRLFDPRVMAVTIRRAIDAVPPLYAANPNLDVVSYPKELVRLFDRANRK